MVDPPLVKLIKIAKYAEEQTLKNWQRKWNDLENDLAYSFDPGRRIKGMQISVCAYNDAKNREGNIIWRGNII
jgi:hypothetical protein